MGFGNFNEEEPEVVEMDISFDEDDGPEVVEIVTIDSEDEREEDEKESTLLRNLIETWTQEKIEKMNRPAEVIDLTLDDDDEDVAGEESSGGGNCDYEHQGPQAVERDESSADINADADPQCPQAMDDDNEDADTVVIEEEEMPNPAEEEAEGFNSMGNERFGVGNYYQALEMYTKAIDTYPKKASYYANRSACYMMMQRYKDALVDIKQSLQIDSGYEKSYFRLIRTTLALGNVRECELAFESAEKVSIKKQDAAFEHEFERLEELKKKMLEIESAREKKDYRQLYYSINQALETASANINLKVMKAYALVRLGRLEEAREASNEVLKSDKRSVEARYFKAVCEYLEDRMEPSIQCLREALRDAREDPTSLHFMKFLKNVKALRD